MTLCNIVLAYRKRSRAAQKLSSGRIRPACHCLDHAAMSYSENVKKITLVPLRLRLFVNKSILAPFLFRKFTKDSSRSPLLQSSSCTPLTGISSAMEIRAASASSGVRRKFSWGGSFSGIWCSYVFGLSCL